MKVKCIGYKRDERYFTIGKIYEIKNGKLTADNGYTYGEYFTYTDEDLLEFLSDWYKFEPVNECIVIYRKGNEVIALDKSTGKKSIAKCDPRDKFDFMTGAKLAFKRLTKNVTFRVLCVEDYKDYVAKGKIYEFVDGKTVFNTGMESCRYNSFEEFKENNDIMAKRCVELKDGDDPKEILKKYDNDVKVGDTVKIVDAGYQFTSNINFFVDNNISLEIVARFKYGEIINKNITYKVVAMGDLEFYQNKACVVKNSYGECYLIGIKGLKKC